MALLLLILFTLLRSVLWASVQPAWFAPDEDYHWLYINCRRHSALVAALSLAIASLGCSCCEDSTSSRTRTSVFA